GVPAAPRFSPPDGVGGLGGAPNDGIVVPPGMGGVSDGGAPVGAIEGSDGIVVPPGIGGVGAIALLAISPALAPAPPAPPAPAPPEPPAPAAPPVGAAPAPAAPSP
ncbi:MAG: C4-dicarboxylate ABC transporter, partial [bacterium]